MIKPEVILSVDWVEESLTYIEQGYKLIENEGKNYWVKEE